MGNKELGIADPVYDALRIRSGQSIAPDLGGGSTDNGGHVIQDEGSDLTARPSLNFVGVGVTATDDAGNDATKVTIPGMTMWYNVKDYGAVGDGTTDDTTAINDTIAAIPAAGGVLYFPTGTYKVTSGLTLAKPIVVRGDMSSQINFTSSSTSLFTVTADKCSFLDLFLNDTSGVTPTAGSVAITVQAGGFSEFRNVIIIGFYICMDIQEGHSWLMDHCTLIQPTKYALKIWNGVDGDVGDWSIVACEFVSYVASDAAIRIESSGGGKIVSSKINSSSLAVAFVNGIDMNVQGGSTSVLLISNSSIENVSGDGIHLRNTSPYYWDQIIISGVQFGMYSNSGGHAISIVGAAAAHLFDVIIDGCVFLATGSPGSAIDLQYVDRAYIGTYINDGFSSLLTTSNTTDIKQIGVGSGTVTSIAAGTGITATPDPIVATGTIAIANTAVTPATYGDASNIPQITVDQQGRITAASNIAISVFTPINAYNETQSADGTSLTYYLTNYAAPSTIRVYIDGIRQPASDDSAATDIVTFDIAPDAGALLLFDYEMDIA